MEDGRKAGTKLLQFFLTDPLGEEILEGSLGGLMVGASQIGSDQPLGQTALETAAAIAGGIGLGAAGRRIGARLGKRIHGDALKDQSGMMATLGRVMGSETTAEGVKQQGRQMRSLVEQGLMNESAAQMMKEVVADPVAFQAKYKIDPKDFETMVSSVMAGRAASGAVKSYAELSPEQRAGILQQIQPILDKYGNVERAVAENAVNSLDGTINGLAAQLKKAAEQEGLDGDKRKMLSDIGGFVQGMNMPVSPVTGEHVGRAIGRFIGDEVGIIGGMAVGSLLSQQLGMESPKDRQIRELEKQLAGRA